jgi:hypothetical protein
VIRRDSCRRIRLISSSKRADRLHDLDVGLLVPAADVVGLADAAASSTARMPLQWSFTYSQSRTCWPSP